MLLAGRPLISQVIECSETDTLRQPMLSSTQPQPRIQCLQFTLRGVLRLEYSTKQSV